MPHARYITLTPSFLFVCLFVPCPVVSLLRSPIHILVAHKSWGWWWFVPTCLYLDIHIATLLFVINIVFFYAFVNSLLHLFFMWGFWKTQKRCYCCHQVSRIPNHVNYMFLVGNLKLQRISGPPVTTRGINTEANCSLNYHGMLLLRTRNILDLNPHTNAH